MNYKTFVLTISKYCEIKGILDIELSENHYKSNFDNCEENPNVIVAGIKNNEIYTVACTSENGYIPTKTMIQKGFEDEIIEGSEKIFILDNINEKIYIDKPIFDNRITIEFIQSVKDKIKKYENETA